MCACLLLLVCVCANSLNVCICICMHVCACIHRFTMLLCARLFVSLGVQCKRSGWPLSHHQSQCKRSGWSLSHLRSHQSHLCHLLPPVVLVRSVCMCISSRCAFVCMCSMWICTRMWSRGPQPICDLLLPFWRCQIWCSTCLCPCYARLLTCLLLSGD